MKSNTGSQKLVSHSTAAVKIYPTNVNWVCYSGVIFRYLKRSADELIASGLLSPKEIPFPGPGLSWKRYLYSTCETVRVTSCRDGSYNVCIHAAEVMARDANFKLFLGRLLSDTRLSLVRGERP